jgi:hypothetical protein
MNKALNALVFAHIAGVVFFTGTVVCLLAKYPPKPHRLCAVAEISPDFTPEERERCRLVRGRKL